MSDENQGAPPAVQAISTKVRRAGKGGIVPPVAHQFKPGVSGNPAGRPNAGLSIKEEINRMSRWKTIDVQRVYDDTDSTLVERAAAKAWLEAFTADLTAAGHARSGDGLDRVIDRTDGKATSKLQVEQVEAMSQIDVGRLDGDELAMFTRLLRKTMALPELVEQSLPALP